MIRNWEGKPIKQAKILRDESYLYVNELGETDINWSSPGADDEGFDVEHREPNGHWRMLVELPVGTLLLRYGTPGGYFTAPKGTSYEELSLPYEKDSMEYNEYRVINKSLLVEVCQGERGRAAPLFDQPGGGVQYYHGKDSVAELVRRKLLERIELWQSSE